MREREEGESEGEEEKEGESKGVREREGVRRREREQEREREREGERERERQKVFSIVYVNKHTQQNVTCKLNLLLHKNNNGANKVLLASTYSHQETLHAVTSI